MSSVFVIGPQEQTNFVLKVAKVVRNYGVKATEILAPPASAQTPTHEWVLHAFQHIVTLHGWLPPWTGCPVFWKPSVFRLR